MPFRDCRRYQFIGAFVVATTLLSGCEISGPDLTAPSPTPATPTVASVAISGSAGTATTGQTRALVATATLSDGTTRNVTTLANWTTSNATVATVGGTGAVNFLKAGGVDIKATYQGVTGSLTFNVGVAAPTVTTVIVSGIGGTAALGQSAALVATALFSDSTTADVTSSATWSSSNLTVATITANGTVTFRGVGDVDLQATFNNVVGATRVTVGAATPTVVSVTITGVGSTATVGQSAALMATVRFSDNTTADVTTEASWGTSNPSVATVSSAGSVTFIGAGDVTFTAGFGGSSAARQVAVTTTVMLRNITGVVTDGVNNRPAERVLVLALGGPNEGRRVETDANGNYALDRLETGSFMLQFSSAAGEFAATTRTVTLSADMRVDVSLTPTFDVFYGLFNIILTKTLDTCSSPVNVGPTATLLLAGNSDGSNFTAKLTERGVSRTYFGGRMKADGKFDGVLPTKTLLPGVVGAQMPQHDIDGPIDGRVIGNGISGTETLIYFLPCIGQQINISFAGGR
mgnify:CR=1 FL=1